MTRSNRLANASVAVKQFFLMDKAVYQAATIGSLVAIILSPLSVWIGFSLERYLSRPLVSIENVNTIPVHAIPKAVLDDISKLLPDIRSELGTMPISGNITAGDLSHLVSMVEERILQGATQKSKSSADIPKVDLPALDSEGMAGEEPTTMLQTLIRQNELSAADDSDKAGKLTILRQALQDVGLECRLYMQVSYLNRGGADELVTSSGDIVFDSGALIKATLTAKPAFLTKRPAVPVLIEDPQYFGSATSVGKIAQAAITQMWYLADTPITGELCQRGEFELHILNYDGSPIHASAVYD